MFQPMLALWWQQTCCTTVSVSSPSVVVMDGLSVLPSPSTTIEHTILISGIHDWAMGILYPSVASMIGPWYTVSISGNHNLAMLYRTRQWYPQLGHVVLYPSVVSTIGPWGIPYPSVVSLIKAMGILSISWHCEVLQEFVFIMCLCIFVY